MQGLTLPKAKPRVSPWALSPWALPQWQLWEGTNPPPRAWHGLRHWEGAGRGTGRVGSLGWVPVVAVGVGDPLCTYLVVLCRAGRQAGSSCSWPSSARAHGMAWAEAILGKRGAPTCRRRSARRGGCRGTRAMHEAPVPLAAHRQQAEPPCPPNPLPHQPKAVDLGAGCSAMSRAIGAAHPMPGCVIQPPKHPSSGVPLTRHAGEGEMAGRGLQQGSPVWGLQCLGGTAQPWPGCRGVRGDASLLGLCTGPWLCSLGCLWDLGEPHESGSTLKAPGPCPVSPSPAFRLHTAMCQEVA